METITLFKGMAEYDGGDVVSPLIKESWRYTKEELSRILERRLGTASKERLEELALAHARYSGDWSPGISFTSDFSVAVEFAEKSGLPSNPGVVIEVELPKDRVVSIVDLAKKGKKPRNFPEELIFKEQEHVFFGTVLASWVKKVHHIEPARVT